jgi:hypothetical protein
MRWRHGVRRYRRPATPVDLALEATPKIEAKDSEPPSEMRDGHVSAYRGPA